MQGIENALQTMRINEMRPDMQPVQGMTFVEEARKYSKRQ